MSTITPDTNYSALGSREFDPDYVGNLFTVKFSTHGDEPYNQTVRVNNLMLK